MIPRVLIAGLLAVTISKPLELGIFHDAIDTQIELRNDRVLQERSAGLSTLWSGRVSAIEAEVAALNLNRDSLRNTANRLQNEWFVEMNGNGGSNVRGDGRIAERKRVAFLAASDAYTSELKTQERRRRLLEAQLDSIAASKTQTLQTFRASMQSGFLSRLNALDELQKTEPASARASLVLMLLILMVELSPILAKLLAPYGPYDAKLELLNDSETLEAEYKRDSRVAIAKHHFTTATEAEKRIDSEFFDSGVAIRSDKIRDAWTGFQDSVRVRVAPSVDELFESVRDVLSYNRKT
jgi:hypothetical protein